ncbi:cytoplasmic tRNA 2-thiolation protein 2-A [Helicoverpa armigera]|uniref:cytoplasmic tRNA 2-thiolation protein 2-A n=1 Tax=Helicoverpa armigera TaxID=29058 RepID=UPI003082A284
MNCKKCDSSHTVLLRKKDYYCDDCFMVNTNHKFRACIGKNKILIPNENVLIGISGGVGSTVLLDLVNHAVTLENTKKLRIVPFFVHLLDEERKDSAQAVIKQCNKYNINVYIIHLAEYMDLKFDIPKPNCIPETEEKKVKSFHDMLNSMPITAAKDLLLKVKRNLLVEFAKKVKCRIVFTGETTNTLAINLLTNLATGRGAQVQDDIGFCDVRDKEIKILRPIKDISKEELDYYVAIKQLSPFHEKDVISNSLQSVIASFVSDLQKDFQATISTVCKTADKIGNQEIINDEQNMQGKCVICKSNLHTRDLNISALEATNVSRKVSLGNAQFRQDLDNNPDISTLESDATPSVFPLINKYLCYGCSRNQSERNQTKLPPYIEEALKL